MFLDCVIRHHDLEVLDQIEYYVSRFVINVNNIQHLALSGNNVVLHSGVKESIFTYRTDEDAKFVYDNFSKALGLETDHLYTDLKEFGYIQSF